MLPPGGKDTTKERPRPTRLRVITGRWQEFQHDVLGMPEPRIVLDAAPNDHCHDPAGLEACAHVAQARNRILEKLGAESGKAEIMHRLERICLHVSFQKRDVAKPRGARIAPPVFEKAIAAIHREHRPGWPNQTRQLDRRIPKAAAGINRPVAFIHLQRRKDFFAMKCQSAHEDVPPTHEFWHQDTVPEFNILASRLRRDLGIAHDGPHSSISEAIRIFAL